MSALTVGALGAGTKAIGQIKTSSVALIANPNDPLVSSPPVAWALQELEAALTQKGIKVQRTSDAEKAVKADLYVFVASNHSALTSNPSFKLESKKPEANALFAHKYKGSPALLATGSDARGLMYAVLELADQAQHSTDPVQSFKARKSVIEEPFNQTRSVARLFVSDIEDKPWFNDREFWPAYFSMLAKQRVN
ncbi:MAG TPA: hypothetical protein VLK33_14440, partial [Terriglobales bacterium]|nr:hypothetical protein [Terriglobales bacterium]